LEIPVGKKLTSFANKVIGLTILVVLGSQAATVMAVLMASSRDANEQAQVQLDSGVEIFRGVSTNRAKLLEQTVRPLTADSEFKRAVVSRDKSRLTKELQTRVDWVDADVALLLSLDGSIITDVGLNAVPDTSLDRLTREPRTGISINNRMYEMVTVPVEAPTIIGWVSIGFSVDGDLANELAAITGLEVTFMSGMDSGRISMLGTSLPQQDRELLVNAALRVADGSNHYAAIKEMNQRYLSNREYFFPEGDEIFVVLQKPLTEAMAAYEALRGTILHSTSITLLCALVMSIILSRSVTSPIHRLLAAARRIRVGDYANKLSVNSKDEMGELADAFESMRLGIAEREQRIVHQAQFDSLTGLPNRIQGYELLREKLRAATKANEPVGIIIMHLQRFREIQSSLGHEIGDEVLHQTALRLQSELDDETVLARLEGDQFLVIAPHADRAASTAIARKLSSMLDAGLTVQSINVTLDACIGICLFPDHGRQPDELLRRAAVAKDDAQRSQRRIRFYRNGREARYVRQLAILGDLRRATEENELQLYLQPKITLSDTLVCGAEALLRWEHPELGQIPPAEFIPLAENAGSIAIVTEWVLDRAIAQCRQWHDQNINLPIAVNLSRRDLINRHLPELIAKTLTKYAVEPSALILEVTEEALVYDTEQACNVLSELKAMGCATSMDDFGIGYSSLGNLQNLPVDELKIDRQFVMKLPENEQTAAIVRSIIELAHNLDMEVVAEGVETTAALRWLREEGCERAQGFYLSKPMPAERFVGWLRNWEKLAREDQGNLNVTDSLILRPRLIT
jgi:diguanylate cyclase (GGDEF)-like protein